MEDNVLLEVKDLHVKVENKIVLSGVNLKIGQGETCVLFGPNGSGKTTLISTLMGFWNYKVVNGEIIFKGRNITHLPLNERAKMGMGISFQRPPSVKGVKLRHLTELSARGDGNISALIDEYARMLNLSDFLDRDVNVGFSGGEIKRSELLQLILQDPTVVFMDEPESGVDLENIALIGDAINQLLGVKHEPKEGKSLKELRLKRKSCLMITHTGHILQYVNADIGYILLNGKIVCEGNPREILDTISECGYDECYRCLGKESKDGGS